MIKIEFPADRADIARAIAAALRAIADGTATSPVDVHVTLPAPVAQITCDVAVHPDSAAQPVATAVQTAAGHVNTQTGEVVELEQPANPGDAMRLDLKGVAFDDRFCANAQDPFYSSGKEKGQWKAKRGLAAGVYEQWYEQQLSQPAHTMYPPAVDEETDTTPTVATGAAFGAVQATVAPTLKTAGDFMAWVSEKQTAGKLTQDVINTAYASLGIRVQDLFAPTPDHVVANNIAALHGYLSQTAGA